MKTLHLPPKPKPFTRERGALLCFGLGGHTIDFVPTKLGGCDMTSHLSGYENPESFQTRFSHGDYAKYDIEGVPVIDKRGVLAIDPRPAFSSPMVRVSLADDEVNRFSAIFPGSGPTDPGTPAGGLDYISVPAYVAWWQEKGARIGTFRDGKIHWNDDLTFPITLQSPDGRFLRRIHSDGRMEKKILGMTWEPHDEPNIRLDRVATYVTTMTTRLKWKQS